MLFNAFGEFVCWRLVPIVPLLLMEQNFQFIQAHRMLWTTGNTFVNDLLQLDNFMIIFPKIE